MGTQARAGTRIALDCPAALTLLDQTRYPARTIDLSAGGICLQLDTQIRLAQLCAIHFEVALGAAKQQILAVGQVIYSDPDPAQGFKTGVQFLKVDPASTAAIAALLRANAV